MNSNKLEDKAEDIQTADNENDSSDNIPSHSSNFKDLYDDLLNTLNATPKTQKQTESLNMDMRERNRQTSGAGSKSAKVNEEPAKRTSNLNELLEMIDSKTESKKSPAVSENSFKDTIVNSEIFDSVVKDLNKQKVERSEKKKERDAKPLSSESTTPNASAFGADIYKDEASETKTNENFESPEKKQPRSDISGAREAKVYENKADEIATGYEKEADNHEEITPKVKDYMPFANIDEEDSEDEYEHEYKERTRKSDNRREAGQDKPISKKNVKPPENITKPEVRNIGAKKNRNENENENDDELLKAFGINYGDSESENYEGERLGRNTGNIAGDTRKARSPRAKAKMKSLHQLVNGEYVSYEQNTDIFAGYKKIYTSEWIKLIASAVCLLVLLYMEVAPHFNLPLPYFLDIKFYNVVYILIDLQLLLIVAWLNSDSLIFGIKSVFSSVVNIYYISVFFVLVTFIHTFCTYIMRYNNPDMVLFNSVTVFGLALVGLYNLLDTNIEIMGFKVVSSKKPKYAVYLNKNSVLEMDEFRDIIPENTVVGNISRTNFMNNFFSRINKKKIHGSYEKYFLVISASIAALLFAVLLGFKVDKYTALSSAVTVLLCSIPLCSVIVSIFPLYKAQKTANAMLSAVVGSESVNEHSEISIISVHDRDIFPPELVKISDVRIFGNNRLEVLQYFRAVFEKLNFVLAESFKSSTTYENNFDTRIDIVSIAENGICFISNGRKLFMGNREYISNIGLSVNYSQNFDEQFLKSSGSILFLASDREVISKLCIKYEVVPDFFDILKNLNKSNICLGIRTFDPSIDDELIRKLSNFKKFPVKIVKLKNPDDVYMIPESMESGIVSKASLKSFIRTLLLCNKTKSVIKSNILIQTIAFIAGVGLTTLVTILGIAHNEIWTINSLYIMLFHSFWMFPIVFLSGLTPR